MLRTLLLMMFSIRHVYADCQSNSYFLPLTPATNKYWHRERIHSPKLHGDWPVYVISPEHLNQRWEFMRTQIPDANRVKVTRFPENASRDTKEYIVAQSHLQAWRIALQENLSDHGFIFLEDDMIMLNNWRGWLQAVLETSGPHVVRFDTLPYEYHTDSDAFISLTPRRPWCSGGYFLTRMALTKLVKVASVQNPVTIEKFLYKFQRGFFETSTKTTIPRLAIQNWIYGKTNIQNEILMSKLKRMQSECYLPMYNKWYNISMNKYKKIFNVDTSVHGLNDGAENRHGPVDESCKT